MIEMIKQTIAMDRNVEIKKNYYYYLFDVSSRIKK